MIQSRSGRSSNYDTINHAIATTDALNLSATLSYGVFDHVIASTDFKGNPNTHAYRAASPPPGPTTPTTALPGSITTTAG